MTISLMPSPFDAAARWGAVYAVSGSGGTSRKMPQR